MFPTHKGAADVQSRAADVFLVRQALEMEDHEGLCQHHHGISLCSSYFGIMM